MITKEQLMNTISSGKCNKLKGVLTSEEALEFIRKNGYITILSTSLSVELFNQHVKPWFFLSDESTFGAGVLPKVFSNISLKFPHHVVPRETIPDGNIDTIEKLISCYEPDSIQLHTIEELVDYLNPGNSSTTRVLPTRKRTERIKLPVSFISQELIENIVRGRVIQVDEYTAIYIRTEPAEIILRISMTNDGEYLVEEYGRNPTKSFSGSLHSFSMNDLNLTKESSSMSWTILVDFLVFIDNMKKLRPDSLGRSV